MPGQDGTLCPRYRHDPHTLEGRTALTLALAPGIWRRAGMGGAMTGIDYAAAKALGDGLAQGSDWGRVVRLLHRFETGAIAGEAKRLKDRKEESQ